ncbi:hypothetical protein KSP40_PGU016610 [Platanthera guangdongensis]|uniref:Uncharacterized protein n=1 Tax=Platanthera guangdongensis TaxID=2320717 RepID=A0ABR2N4U4_9ASPA
MGGAVTELLMTCLFFTPLQNTTAQAPDLLVASFDRSLSNEHRIEWRGDVYPRMELETYKREEIMEGKSRDPLKYLKSHFIGNEENKRMLMGRKAHMRARNNSLQGTWAPRCLEKTSNRSSEEDSGAVLSGGTAGGGAVFSARVALGDATCPPIIRVSLSSRASAHSPFGNKCPLSQAIVLTVNSSFIPERPTVKDLFKRAWREQVREEVLNTKVIIAPLYRNSSQASKSALLAQPHRSSRPQPRVLGAIGEQGEDLAARRRAERQVGPNNTDRVKRTAARCRPTERLKAVR